MNPINAILLVLILISCSSQQKILSKYHGIYIQKNENNGPLSVLIVHYEHPGTFLFYLMVSKGAPSHNSGAIYARLDKTNEEGKFIYQKTDSDATCKIEFKFNDNSVIIHSINTDCFLNNLVAEGKLQRKENMNPEFFTNRKGKKVYFTKIKPEEYLE